MHILLTGATGYIGKRLLQALLRKGHDVTCCVRDKNRFFLPEGYENKISILETDFSRPVDGLNAHNKADVAFYLIHSLSTTTSGFQESELTTARNFRLLARQMQVEQVIYLGGIANEQELSEHLSSRKGVEEELQSPSFATTILRAAIIVGSGSASFEIIRDLVEKLPIMITPKWVNTKCQPIAVSNVIDYLCGVMKNEKTYHKTFDIGGPDVLSYKQMMLDFGEVRGLKRRIYTVPVMTPRLSSYWLYFITSTNYKLAVNLVKSMKIEVVCQDDALQKMLQVDLLSYREAVKRAFDKLEQNMVISSWNDALSSSADEKDWSKHIQVPSHGCYVDKRKFLLRGSKKSAIDRIWSIGGRQGWYYANWLWRLRGFMDRMTGGVGLRRGRTNASSIHTGDALDFWRVMVAERNEGRLLLYAEMKLPGEAWLEFNIVREGGYKYLIQNATFRPRGLAGRLYWHLVSPMHHIIFQGMGKRISRE